MTICTSLMISRSLDDHPLPSLFSATSSTTPFMSPAPPASPASPVYCAICAAPCLLPRASIKPPDPTPHQGLVGSDTLDAVIIHNAPESPSGLSGLSGSGPTWLQAWHNLSSIDSAPRTVSIHHYCLEAALRTIRKSTFTSGYTHEETMMLGWSLPKWTGWGPWGFNTPDQDSRHTAAWPSGFWTGTASQRSRWQRKTGNEGSHLLPVGPS